MKKKQFEDENGNQFVQVKPWFKRWSTWGMGVVTLALVIVLIAWLSGQSGPSDTTTATAHSTTKLETQNTASASSADTKLEKITIDDDNDSEYEVADKKSYKYNYTDTNWSAAMLKVNKVTVYKLKHPVKYESDNDGTFKANGFVRINLSISPKQDINAYATQGTAVYSNGEQHDADLLENWDGEITKGATKSGDVTIPVQELSKVKALKQMRFKFDADYDTDDDYDDNSNHTFDMMLDLK